MRLLPFARHSRERGNPVPFVRERLKSLDSRVRGNDDRRSAQVWLFRSGTSGSLEALKL
ncbi:hypothetical protein [Lysobacter gummosus]|uniref:hypothetical protein n=1 Tax=Lysobacter gummosus TaxID=262324 RepID=UPI00363C23A6